MTSRSTRGRRLGAAALGVGLGLLAFGFVSPVDTDPTVVDSVTDDGRTNRAPTDDDTQRSAVTVAGITVTRTDDSPTSAPDYTLMILGAVAAAAGVVSLTLSNRGERATTEPPPRPQHIR